MATDSSFFLRVLGVLQGSIFCGPPGRVLLGSALCLLSASTLTAAPAEHALRLPKDAQQGQLVIGHAPRGSEVEFAGRKLRVGNDGAFVFGLDRDAPPRVSLHVHYRDGKDEARVLAVAERHYRIERIEGLPPKTVTPDPETAARIEREQAAVAQARKRDDAREDFLHGFALPVAGARISGVYGSQRIDNGVAKAPHPGLDLAVPTGTPVHAPAAGVVTFAEPDLVLTGGTVLIDHGHGLTSSFLHMSRLDVAVGQRVERGQVIGAAGMTGRATGPHVHWGFNWFDVRLDPALLPKPAP
jgi:murein DD-endopeptidase MepM/ murein hydrolase activator NlpD